MSRFILQALADRQPATRATWGNWYWPAWLVTMGLTLLVAEVYALVTNVYNTQSYWVWKELNVTVDHTRPWSAFWFLTFGAWLVLFTWLTFHFFFRKFT